MAKKYKYEYKAKDYTAKASGGGAYFLGFIGAAVYFIQASNGFWDGALGLLQALVWPAFLVYELLKLVYA